MRKNRKKILVILSCILLVLIVVGVSYAFTIADITEINKTETKINTIVLNEGTCQRVDMSCDGIVPGDQCTKEFSITNPNNGAMVVNLYMNNTINEFYSGLNDLVYTLKDKSTGDTLVGETVLPGSNSERYYILRNVTIQPHSTRAFKFVVDYKYLSTIDQSAFQDSEFKTNFCADTDQFNCNNQCNGTCPNVGDVLGATDDCPEKVSLVTAVENNTYCTKEIDNPYCNPGEPNQPTIPWNQETGKQCEDREKNKLAYGTEVAIHHDLYFADETLYSTGKNERYVTYCRPWKKGDESGIEYCSSPLAKTDCVKITGKTECTYQNAIKDLGYTSTKAQRLSTYFADRGNGNWHIQEYCTKANKKTKWPGNGNGVYYCNDDATVLHDWYADTTSTTEDIDQLKDCYTKLQIGDYVYSEPTKKEYKIPASETGYNSEQSINPSELKLWRVTYIRNYGTNVDALTYIPGDGSYEAVSEYTSSNEIYFRGRTGYKNLVGALNKIASAYENPVLTVETRSMGSNFGQTQYMTEEDFWDWLDVSAYYEGSSYVGGRCITNIAEWNNGMNSDWYINGDVNNYDPDDVYSCSVDSDGVDDYFDHCYINDYHHIGETYKANDSTSYYGTTGLKAYDARYNNSKKYWLASRRYYRTTNCRTLDVQGQIIKATGEQYAVPLAGYNYQNDLDNDTHQDGWTDEEYSAAIRPIIRIKSNIRIVSGSGTKEDPYHLMSF